MSTPRRGPGGIKDERSSALEKTPEEIPTQFGSKNGRTDTGGGGDRTGEQRRNIGAERRKIDDRGQSGMTGHGGCQTNTNGGGGDKSNGGQLATDGRKNGFHFHGFFLHVELWPYGLAQN